MKCPYCEKEMEQGFIQSAHEISWKKGDKRPLFGRAQFHEGSVILSELSFMKGSAVTAFSIMKSGRSVPGHSRSDNTSNDKIKRSGSPDVPGLSAL